VTKGVESVAGKRRPLPSKVPPAAGKKLLRNPLLRPQATSRKTSSTYLKDLTMVLFMPMMRISSTSMTR
jgi:hypothetical protein